MKPLLITSGEPAGIGPDVCLALANYDYPVVIAGDLSVLKARAKQLDLTVDFEIYQPASNAHFKPRCLQVMPISCPYSVQAGQLQVKNASYVINMLEEAIDACLSHHFSAIVTAPVHKAVINEAGIAFTGHTEFFATRCQADTIVMMLACKAMKIALVTTHIPLKSVPDAINQALIQRVVDCLNTALKQDFGCDVPRIAVAGLNPHAGESGYLGDEEIKIISPALHHLQHQGIHVEGPFSADTLFMHEHLKQYDAFVAMYHDQGLPVLKYAGFGHAVNVTLGLPIIRTSVDHGTALALAGSGKANAGSLLAAVEMALEMVKNRKC